MNLKYNENKKVIGFTTAKDQHPPLERLTQLIGYEEFKKKLEYQVADLTPEFIKKVVADGKT